MKIREIVIQNFKGCKKLKINFNSNTKIKGVNASGKTTIADSIYWLFFDKDSSGSANFNFKPIGSKMLETSVEILIDDTRIKKLSKENWVKKRESAEQEFSGNTCEYYFDNMELSIKKKEFQEKINQLIDEKIFKLITNPLAFPRLHWNEQRKILIGLVDKELEEMLEMKEKEKLTLKSKLKKCNEKLKEIPIAVKEVIRNKPIALNNIEHYLKIEDVRKLENENLKNKKRMSASDKIDGIRNSIEKEKNRIEKERTKLATEIAKLNIEIQNEEFLLKKDTQEKINSTNKLANNLKNQLSDLEIELNQKNNQLYFGYEKKIISKENEITELRTKWLEISKETIDIDSHLFCSFCKQKLPDKIDEIVKKFEDTKKKDLENINLDGQKLKNEIAELKKKIEDENQEKTKIENNIETLKLKIKTSSDLILVLEKSIENVYSEKIDKLNEEIKSLECLGIEESTLHNLEETLKELERNDEVLLERIEQEIKLNEAMLKDTQREIAVFAEIEKDEARILELETEQKQYAETYQELSKELFETEEVIKEIVSKLESEINNYFKITKFKLFEVQINGGLKEICEATDLDGTPYSSLNTGMSINCGLDIINTLCKIYKVNFPIFIDNAESVNKILETESQRFHLVVVEPFPLERINKYGKTKKNHLTEEQKKINNGELIISKI